MTPFHPPMICIMGPTASGKTPLAVELVQHFPCEIISVDSALIYREMDIGTAKPDAETLAIAPHRLINICDPSERYSAGQFRADALQHIREITEKGKIPLLVGGTMMYFRVLQQGIADLPRADETLRSLLTARIENEGLSALHAELEKIDPDAAKRIHPNDPQRIQRALEVFLLTGKTITALQTEQTSPLSGYNVINLAIAPALRSTLHERIALRFDLMLQAGFLDEVKKLYDRGDLTPDLPSIRSVGYRQAWDYIAGVSSKEEMREKAIAATRQLAKRQLTWLRTWPNCQWFDSSDNGLFAKVRNTLNPID